jgi:membrane-bound lytic murein transglycosylase D
VETSDAGERRPHFFQFPLIAGRRERRYALRKAISFVVLGALGTTLGVERHLDQSASRAQTALASAPLPPPPPAVQAPTWDLPNLDHERVDYWVRHYTVHNREEFARMLSRSGRYRSMIGRKLAERGMPQDLLYLAMIESAFNPTALSHAKASGLWQFMPGTGRGFGLAINQAVDERNDPVKSTDAALDYLEYLHKKFGSWYLAAAAYNAGEGRIGRLMVEMTGSEKGTELSYYQIWHRLPKETRDYVPRMIASARIAKGAAGYGFDQVQEEEPYRYDNVTLAPGTDLAHVAAAAGTTVSEIRRLNPHFKLDRTRSDEPSEVRLPMGTRLHFLSNWSQAPHLSPMRLALDASTAVPKAKASQPFSPRRSRS